MEKRNKYIIYFHFSAVAKKVISAASFEEAVHQAENCTLIHLDEIIELTGPCTIDKSRSYELEEGIHNPEENMGYQSWGSE